jgi:hypothetical protein
VVLCPSPCQMDIACMEWIIKTKQSGAALDADTPTGVKVCEVEQVPDVLPCTPLRSSPP